MSPSLIPMYCFILNLDATFFLSICIQSYSITKHLFHHSKAFFVWNKLMILLQRNQAWKNVGTLIAKTVYTHGIGSKKHLKTLDTIGNCQRPVSSLQLSQHVHKITNVWKFELNWSSEWRDDNEIPLSYEVSCVLSEIYFFLDNCVISEGVISHRVLFYQQ